MLARITLLCLALLGVGVCLGVAPAQDNGKKPASEKQRREEIDKLIGQLNSDRFKVREEAMRQFMQRDDALSALQKAAKSDDTEVQGRARKAIEAIDKRVAKRALGRAIARLKKGQTDQFVEQVVSWRDYVDEDCWKAAVEHVHAIVTEATKINGGQFNLERHRPKLKSTLPWEDITKLRFIHTSHLKTQKGGFIKGERIVAESVKTADGFIHNSFLICSGTVESKYILGGAVIFANGNVSISDRDFEGMIVGSIVVCDGDVLTDSVLDSVIIARGNVTVESGHVRDSVILSGGEVKRKGPAPAERSLIKDHQIGPLNLVRFFDSRMIGIDFKAFRDEVQVESVTATKPFARAGIRKGDTVVAVDGVRVDSVETLRRLLRRRVQDASAIILSIRREDKPMRVEVRVTDEAP